MTQVLASEGGTVPVSIREAVLARAAALSPGARAVLDLVAVVPGATEIALLEQILDPAPTDLAACARYGLLDVGDDEVAFTHDLQRRAIESALSEVQRSHAQSAGARRAVHRR